MKFITTPKTEGTWRSKVLGVFNLNDGRWGRDETSQSKPDSNNGSPPEENKNPPQQPTNNRPTGNGPPDLDELWRDFNKKLSGFFGASRKGGGAEPPSGGKPSGPSFNIGKLGIGATLAVVVAIWLSTGFFIVQEGQQGVITQFGRYHSTVGAGFNWRLPYPIQRHELVFVTQIRSVDVGRETIVKATGLRESAMLTEDENILEIKFAVQYRLTDARAYLFETKNPTDTVVQAAETAVREEIGRAHV